MVERSFEGGRWTASFRPGRIARFFGTGILGLWLCGWLAGEILAVGIVLASLGVSVAPDLMRRLHVPELQGPQGASGFALAFMLFWLTLWTLGGLTAAFEMMRLLSGEDRVVWDSDGVEIYRRIGPFRSRRRWRVEKIEHVSLSRPHRALLLHTRRATHALTRWGSKAERAAVRDELRRALGIPAREEAKSAGTETPKGWVSTPTPEGAWLLVRDPAIRRRQAAVAWSVTLGLAAGAVFAFGPGLVQGTWETGEALAAVAAALVLALFAFGSAWLSQGGTEMVVRPGEIEIRKRFFSRRSSQKLKPLRLRVEHSTDSDGDDWFELQARAGLDRRTIARRMNESESVLGLARWIAAKSGAPLDVGRGVEEEDRAALAG